MGEPDHPVSEAPVTFSGPAVNFGLTLSRVARGGQVVLSEGAWEAVKPVLNQHPGAAQVRCAFGERRGRGTWRGA